MNSIKNIIEREEVVTQIKKPVAFKTIILADGTYGTQIIDEHSAVNKCNKFYR
jgi:hypothetical protein